LNLKKLLTRACESARAFITLRWVRDAWMYLVRIIERMEDNHIFLSGAAIAFNSLLCFIPLVLVIFYVLGFYLGSEEAIRTIDGYLGSLEMFPYERNYVREQVISLISEFVQGSHIAGIIGVFGLIWTSSTLFAALRTVLNRIFNFRDTKSLVVSKLKDFALLSTVGIALILIIALSYGMTLVKGIAVQVTGGFAEHWIFQSAFLHFYSTAANFVLFCILFTLVPDRRLPIRVTVLSSFIAALLWGIAKALFSYYVSNLWSIGKVYGPYAVVVATAIWVYYSSVTLLLAAEIGEMYIERKNLKNLFREKGMRLVLDSINQTDTMRGDGGR